MISAEDLPQVEIITICKNDEIGINSTISSLRSQSFANWRQIIVVGTSEDNTLKIANQAAVADSRVKVVGDLKAGIYGAMNLGLENSKRGLIWFMNSGDVFCDENTLELAVRKIVQVKTGLLIGGYSVGHSSIDRNAYVKKSRFISAFQLSLNRRGACHQAILFDFNTVDLELKYDENYKLASDFKLILQFAKSSGVYRHTDIYASIEPGGVSSQRIKDVIAEKQSIRAEIFGKISWNYIFGLLWSLGVRIKIAARKLRALTSWPWFA
jgi:glycosyltransferase involved in cell wall biosynthesis